MEANGILDLARVRSGTRLLEIGTGWGTLAIRAAQRGARVTTITLSREQMRLARERVESAGLSGLVEVRVQDYREVDGEYDAIVSVEMIEAVGEAYWPAYFAALDRLLAPGGRVAIQAITMDHQRFLATRRSFSWIQKYIFPGGIIPSLHDAAAAAAAATRVHEELGPIDLAVLSAGYWKQMDPADWDTDVFDRHVQVNLAGMSNSIAAVLPGMMQRHHGVIAGIASVAGYRGLAGAEAYGATKAAQINLLESLRVHIARTGVQVTTVCPGFVHTDLTAGNRFPMPFIIDAGQAARSICDGLERERTEIAFPTRMALLMKTARLVPARAWTALWARTSLT